ncbi:hypothetical protein Fmac_021002 [Flemingia macrophylla]|uniref:Retrovirus-related Pol polyprotein from transposon TNT 1-94-like beta-barrel domain-containing protein n=1 Tax=Flemingia macrophylla TaxID=520843 RepID=A0ABD1LXC9_9FABA
MEENESIQAMFGRFQTIVNELSFLGRTYDNFDHIDKILRSLPRKWRPQVTALRASKDLQKLSLEELIGLLKVHELELQQYDLGRKQKSLALNAQKIRSKPSPSKALKISESSDERWEDLSSSSSKEEVEKEANICLMTDADSPSDSDEEITKISSTDKRNVQSWYLDSGCSRHMTGEMSMFLDLNPRKEAKSRLEEIRKV